MPHRTSPALSQRANTRRARLASTAVLDARVEERLVHTATADGLDLKGALLRPRGERPGAAPLLIWVHTRQQGFAEPEYVEIGRAMVRLGHHFLTVETRGHDFGAWYRTPEGPSLHGSAWEHFADCVLDLDAWAEAAVAMGYRRLVLIGHGFGGAKCVHFQAQRQLPQVAALVLASSGSSVRDKLPPGLEAMARAMAEEGRGQDLLPWSTSGQHYTSTVSAQYYLARSILRAELYGTAELPPAIARIRCPVIAWYGSLEDRPNRRVAEFLDWLAGSAVLAPETDFALIEGLDFFYKGSEAVVVRHLAPRLARLGLGPPQLERRA